MSNKSVVLERRPDFRKAGEDKYEVVKATNTLSPKVGDMLATDEVGDLNMRGIQYTIQPYKRR